MAKRQDLKGPDLEKGVALGELKPGVPFLGHAHGEQVVLVRHGEKVCAVGATCTHYGGPLAEGIVADGTIRCPWHHSRFDLQTGEPSAPALEPIPCWDVVRRDGKVCVTAKRPHAVPEEPVAVPDSVVIVGGGAAGAACVEELRHRGYHGAIVMISSDEPYPVDRPNLSKGFLAGEVGEESLPLLGKDFCDHFHVDFIRDEVDRIDTAQRNIHLKSGGKRKYDAVLLATGAEPRTLDVEGADLEHVHTLRSLQDGLQLFHLGNQAERVVVIGASFIGLEVAASYRQRDIAVEVVAPEHTPLEKALGAELGLAVQRLHEEHGVRFHLGRRPTRITAEHVELDDGSVLPADLVVVGVGVTPRTEVAERSGLEVDDGVRVDERLRTSAHNVWAAGDIARFPYNGSSARIEHWTVAERMGQYVARDILGHHAPFHDAPFFWTRHYDTNIDYVGHAGDYDEVQIVGSLDKRDATVVFRTDGHIVAVATVGRPTVALRAEWAMEHGDEDALEAIVTRAA